MQTLKFQKGNAKLGADIRTFSLPAGWTCPNAQDCLAKVSIDKSGKRSLKDGPKTQFRCFAATAEAVYVNTYNARQHNWAALKAAKTTKKMMQLILDSLPKKATKVRIHVSGDFYNQRYFDAWCQAAGACPNVLFYAYTKSLNYWVNSQHLVPDNLILTASKGGKLDALIPQHGLRSARVVYSEKEAQDLGLEIDHDDSHAYRPAPSFALLIHGVQPKGSKASAALKILKGSSSYSRKYKQHLKGANSYD